MKKVIRIIIFPVLIAAAIALLRGAHDINYIVMGDVSPWHVLAEKATVFGISFAFTFVIACVVLSIVGLIFLWMDQLISWAFEEKKDAKK